MLCSKDEIYPNRVVADVYVLLCQMSKCGQCLPLGLLTSVALNLGVYTDLLQPPGLT